MWGDPNARPQEQGDRITCEELENHVIIVRPVEYIDSMRVKDEYKDAIKLNIVDLTDGGRVYRGTLWFNRLIGTFKHSLGTPFFGYVTKERLPNGYRGWSFVSLAGNPDWEPTAQAWIAANPDFLTEPLPEKRERVDPYAHHEQGPASEWAGPVAPRPPAPPAPRPAVPAPPAARPAAPVSAPPRPVSTPPAPPVPPPGAGESMLERLRRQAEQPFPPASANQTSGDAQEPPY